MHWLVEDPAHSILFPETGAGHFCLESYFYASAFPNFMLIQF